jgi:hypothetical protein
MVAEVFVDQFPDNGYQTVEGAELPVGPRFCASHSLMWTVPLDSCDTNPGARVSILSMT